MMHNTNKNLAEPTTEETRAPNHYAVYCSEFDYSGNVESLRPKVKIPFNVLM